MDWSSGQHLTKKTCNNGHHILNKRLGFEIVDNSIGIDPAHIDRNFEFGKSRKSASGFGLYCCKMFFENSCGRFTFFSRGTEKRASVMVAFDKTG